MRDYIEAGTSRILEVDGDLVSTSHFNATSPDIVQVGGVWTPPKLRRCGYARSVVAGHLLEARGDGVKQAILFTEARNQPAHSAYEALDFERVGHYGLVLFEGHVRLPDG